MTDTALHRIRRIFLNTRPHIALMTAADLLGMPLRGIEREIADGSIVAVSTGVGRRITREEIIAVAMRTWPQDVIEEALGSEADAVLREAIRLVELRARIPRYQRDMLHFLAQRNQTTVDDVLARELEDVACAHAEELSSAVAGFEAALVWPGAVLGGGPASTLTGRESQSARHVLKDAYDDILDLDDLI